MRHALHRLRIECEGELITKSFILCGDIVAQYSEIFGKCLWMQFVFFVTVPIFDCGKLHRVARICSPHMAACAVYGNHVTFSFSYFFFLLAALSFLCLFCVFFAFEGFHWIWFWSYLIFWTCKNIVQSRTLWKMKEIHYFLLLRKTNKLLAGVRVSALQIQYRGSFILGSSRCRSTHCSHVLWV